MSDKGGKIGGFLEGANEESAVEKKGIEKEMIDVEELDENGRDKNKSDKGQPVEISGNSGSVRDKVRATLESVKGNEVIPVLDLEKLYSEMRVFIDALVAALPKHKKKRLRDDEKMFLRIISDIGFGSYDLANADIKLTDVQKKNLRNEGAKISSDILENSYRYWEEQLNFVVNILKEFDKKGMAAIATVEENKIKLNEKTILRLKKLMDAMMASYANFGRGLRDIISWSEQYIEMNDLKNSRIAGMDRSTLKDGDMPEDFVDSTINVLLKERLLKLLKNGESKEEAKDSVNGGMKDGVDRGVEGGVDEKIKETLLLAVSSNFTHLNVSIASQIKPTMALLLEDIQDGVCDNLDQYIDDPNPLYDSEGKLLAFVLTSFNRALRGVIESQRLKSLVDIQNKKEK